MVLSLNVVAKMKLDFEQVMIALSVCITMAAFLLYFVAKMILGSVEADHQGERFAENHLQERKRGRGKQRRSTDWPARENFANNSLLRQRTRPQENDEPFWQTVRIYFLT